MHQQQKEQQPEAGAAATTTQYKTYPVRIDPNGPGDPEAMSTIPGTTLDGHTTHVRIPIFNYSLGQPNPLMGQGIRVNSDLGGVHPCHCR